MENSLLEELLQKYLMGAASESEERLLIEWYYSFNDEHVIVPVAVEDEEHNVYERLKAQFDTMLKGDTDTLNKGVRVVKLRIRYWQMAAACVIIVLLAGSFWLWNNKHALATKQLMAVKEQKILPGHSGAILTLSNGAKIVLDSSANGQIGVQGQSKIIKQGSSLLYAAAGKAVSAPLQYNTMSTPRGREFQVVLPDGTMAWLNASSSIKYPTAFSDTARLVVITGEVYFEVAHLSANTGKRIPFIVQTDRMSVKVLGTHFDVDAYADEQNFKTTLLEGSVEVYKKDEHSTVRIIPGEQAEVSVSSPKAKVSLADLDKVMAWRNGIFQFDDDRLDNILKQISRWYDVDFECTADKQRLRFNGVISRRANVTDILHLLSVTGVVKFKITDRKIYAY